MGETSCLIPSFSNYTNSCVSTQPNQGNSMPVLGESISFGRFTSESLSWDKWSTFSHKRYVEEAERYAQKGSVAQKKAFFEAHYKKIAAKKAAEEAALREQENASNANLDPESECESCITYTYTPITYAPIADGQSNSAELEELKEVVSETKEDVVMENSEKNKELNEEEVSEMAEMEKPLLKDFKSSHDSSPTSKKKVSPSSKHESPISKIKASPSSKAFLQRKTPKIPIPPPAKFTVSANHTKENDPNPITRKALTGSFNGNKSARKTAPKIPTSPAKFSVLVPNRKENDSAINQIRSTPKLLPKILISPASIEQKKETNSTRKTWDFSPVVSMGVKKSTMNTLRTLIYSTPARKPDESNIPRAKKFESLRDAPSSCKASKDCKTPSRTPQMDFVKGGIKNTSAASWSENRRRTTQDTPGSGSKATRPKWHILSAVCSGPLSAHKNKLQSPTLPVSFNLRTEERAARRKQKLEEKFNEKAMPKVQLQTRIKEKAETELRKLRRSLCFRARPLPEFYKEKETPKDQIKDAKIPVAHPEAPNLRRKPIFPSAKAIVSHSSNSDIHSTKNSDFKNLIQKQKGIQNLLTSLSEKTNYENTSPNIKH